MLMRLLVKIVTAAPVVSWVARKTDGYKTIIGAVGIVGVLLAYLANLVHPGIVPPEILSDAALEKILDALMLAFGGVAVGGVAHKTIKAKREIREQDLAQVNAELAALKAQLRAEAGQQRDDTESSSLYEQH